MEEQSPPAPPVPPKDQRYSVSTMDPPPTRPSSAHASGSKRKRDTLDVTSFDADGQDEYTPKRRRSPLRQSDPDVSDETTPAYQKNVRRKKGSRNLSNLNLRHAAEMQKAKAGTLKSKFQEGSLTDKPSEQPPSVFMRMVRTDSGNVRQVDELMEDYHNDNDSAPRDSVERVIAQEKAAIPARVAEIDVDKDNKENAGLFRFGARWAASFHPVALWNKIYGQSREEIIQEDREAAERKAREKAELEARYAEMKKAGAFQPKRIGNIYGSMASRHTTQTPRDSAIVMEDTRDSSDDQMRSASALSQWTATQDDSTGFSASEAPDTATKTFKTLKDRLHFRKPSLANMKDDLKRVKSVSNISQTLNHRESSSSISPVKGEFDQSTLRKSHSKYELKKQHKLSKRVSDLESKLSQARKELDLAIVDASPMPKLGSRYERFTPVSTLKRTTKFMPGKLLSLPSERLLMVQQQGDDVEMSDGSEDLGATKSVDLKEFLAEARVKNDDDAEGEETIKARGGGRKYPTRATSLFNLHNNNIESEATAPINTNNDEAQGKTIDIAEASTTQEHEKMDPNSATNFTSDGMVNDTVGQQPDYAVLDAKLKTLEANDKPKKQVVKVKKRKSGARDEDKAFKPSKDADDEEWSEAEQGPKKKRKSASGAASSPASKRTSRATGLASSPNGKKGSTSKSSPPKKVSKNTAIVQTTTAVEVLDEEEEAVSPGAEMQEVVMDRRDSLDSQTRPLEPVYEEEEEQIAETTTTKTEPTRHTGINSLRSRSASPHKRHAPVQAGAEETMMTRAAEAAKKNPARRGRSNSPPPRKNGTTADGGEVMKLVPGEEGVPMLPPGTKGNENGGEFQWPEDVF